LNEPLLDEVDMISENIDASGLDTYLVLSTDNGLKGGRKILLISAEFANDRVNLRSAHIGIHGQFTARRTFNPPRELSFRDLSGRRGWCDRGGTGDRGGRRDR